MANGTARDLRYCKENTWGDVLNNPVMAIIRNTGGAGIKIGQSPIESQELTPDRGIKDIKFGNQKISTEIPFEFSFGSYDDFLAGLMGSNWTPACNLTDLEISANAANNTFTRASGSWIEDGIWVGDKISLSGFTEPGNNGDFVVSQITPDVLTCGSATGIVNETKGSISLETTRLKLVKGSNLSSFAIEEAFNDINTFIAVAGFMVNTFSLNIQPEAIITGSFGLIARRLVGVNAASISSSIATLNRTPAFDSFRGSIKEQGTEIGIITTLSVSGTNDLAQFYPVMSQEAYKIGIGKNKFTGSVTIFFTGNTFLKKYLDQESTSFEIKIEDSLKNAYVFEFPKIKFTDESRNLQPNNITETLPFQALDDDKGNNLILYKIPA